MNLDFHVFNAIAATPHLFVQNFHEKLINFWFGLTYLGFHHSLIDYKVVINLEISTL